MIDQITILFIYLFIIYCVITYIVLCFCLFSFKKKITPILVSFDEQNDNLQMSSTLLTPSRRPPHQHIGSKPACVQCSYVPASQRWQQDEFQWC